MRRILSLSVVVALALVTPSSGHAAQPEQRRSLPSHDWVKIGANPAAEMPARLKLYQAIAEGKDLQEIVALQRAVLTSPRNEGGSELTALPDAADAAEAAEDWLIDAADFDGDGFDDVLVFQYDEGSTYITARSGLDGGELWTTAVTYPLVAIRDMDGNGTSDVLALTFDVVTSTPVSATLNQVITVYDGASGSKLYDKTYVENYRMIPGRDQGFLYALYFGADSDGDGIGDLVVDTLDVRWVSGGAILAGAYADRATVSAHLVSGDSGEEFATLSTSSQFSEACVLLCVFHGGFADAAPVGDVDGDGLGDLALVGSTMREQWVEAVSAGGGTPHWRVTLANAPAFVFPLQLDGEGPDDLILVQYGKTSFTFPTLSMLNGSSGSPLWTAPPALEPQILFGDVDGDGGEDFENIVFAGESYDLMAQSGATGEAIWSVPLPDPTPPPGGFFEGYICACATDLTGDGVNDESVLVRVLDENFAVVDTALSVISGEDGSTAWTTSFGAEEVFPFPLGGDVNGDGSGDLVWTKSTPSTTTFTFINGADGAPAGSLVHVVSASDHGEFAVAANLTADGADEILVQGYSSTCDDFFCTFVADITAYLAGGSELWSL